MSCALMDCGNPNCQVCSVPRRFPAQPAARMLPRDADELKATAPAFNGTKPRPSRDPALIKRRRKAL